METTERFVYRSGEHIYVQPEIGAVFEGKALVEIAERNGLRKPSDVLDISWPVLGRSSKDSLSFLLQN